MMRGAWASVSDLAVVPMQDILGLGSEARMNTPSTLGCNWKWRAAPNQITPKLAAKVRKYMKMYGREGIAEPDHNKQNAVKKRKKRKRKKNLEMQETIG